MAKNEISIREGSTDYVDFQVTSDNVAIDLTSIDHVELNLKDRLGNITTFTSAGGSPKLYRTDDTNGMVELRPASTDFYAVRSFYSGYLLIYETATRFYSVPADTELKILVREAF